GEKKGFFTRRRAFCGGMGENGGKEGDGDVYKRQAKDTAPRRPLFTMNRVETHLTRAMVISITHVLSLIHISEPTRPGI
ncbi:hypothetical protein ACNQ0S_25080, partial [Enterobacter cloacae complex sp.6700816]|uniref:hypothetical protein n=1 Tax=Enterobacter cloacae complex sp.6700816 TaxID=3397178 RepID=UPI003AAB5C0A